MTWTQTAWIAVGLGALLLSAVAILIRPELRNGNEVDGRQAVAKLASAGMAVYLWWLFSLNAGTVIVYSNGVANQHEYASIGILALVAGFVVAGDLFLATWEYVALEEGQLKFT